MPGKIGAPILTLSGARKRLSIVTEVLRRGCAAKEWHQRADRYGRAFRSSGFHAVKLGAREMQMFEGAFFGLVYNSLVQLPVGFLAFVE